MVRHKGLILPKLRKIPCNLLPVPKCRVASNAAPSTHFLVPHGHRDMQCRWVARPHARTLVP